MSVGDPEFEIKTKQLKDMDPDFPTHLSGGYIYVPVLYGE